MTVGNPTKVLLLFALPMLIGNVLQNINVSFKSIIVGQNVGINELGAIGATNGLNFFFMSMVIGLSIGVSVIVSQFYGAKDEDGISKSVGTGIALIAGISLVMGILGIIFTRPLIELLQTPQNLIEPAHQYLQIMFLGMLPLGIFHGVASILRAFGDAKSPLYLQIIGSIVGLILIWLFVIQLQWGVRGAAIGTVTGQVLGAIMLMVYALKKNEYFDMSIFKFKLNHKIAKTMLKLGLPASIQFTLLSFGNMLIQIIINGFGYDVVTAYTVALAICMIAYAPSFALGSAVSTFAGQNKGANQIARIKSGTWSGIKIVAVISVVITLIVQIFARNLLHLFMDQSYTNIVDIGVGYLRIISIFYGVIGMMFIFRETLRGIGDAITPMVMGTIDIVVRVGCAFILSRMFGYTGVWWASPIAWSVSLSIGLIVFLRGKWQYRDLVKSK